MNHLSQQPAEFTFQNKNGVCVSVHLLGATWTSCQVPVNGQMRELLLGSRDIAAMLAGSSYLGASIGRYAGRIAGAEFSGHALDANQPPNTLHGGRHGLSRRLWQIQAISCCDGLTDIAPASLPRLTPDLGCRGMTLQINSPAGDQGFPGHLLARVHYLLADDDSLTILYTATTSDAPTPCNFTNHAYFNLNGGDGDNGLAQFLTIPAHHYQPVGADGIPLMSPRPVDGTGFDFRQGKWLDKDFLRDPDQRLVGGYDHSFLLSGASGQSSADPSATMPPITTGDITSVTLQPAASLRSADGRVTVEIHTNQPAIHLYTGQYLQNTEKRDGSAYANLAGIALESQYPPDSPHHGRAILQPGDTYCHIIRYTFRY
ncbi:MAG: hypothetical protein Q4B13_07985 [Lautropia sp.]|nr:hypothetical protein [Lautropia sp.]